jgi:hypothetical protein
MSFKEKIPWISLVSTIGIFGYYFYNIVLLKNIPLETAKPIAITLLIKACVMSSIVETMFQGMLTSVMITLGHLLFLEFNPAWASDNSMQSIPLLTAHILIFSFILSEIVRFTAQLVYYRSNY